MKKQYWFRRLAALALSLLLCGSCLPGTAFAYDEINTSRDCTLTVSFAPKGRAAAGVAFRAYRVANMWSENGNIRFGVPFGVQDFAITGGMSASGWDNLAWRLTNYAQRQSIAATDTAWTDANGRARFTGANGAGLPVGLYLVVGDSFRRDDYVYTPSAFLVALPNSTDGKTWTYQVNATPKFSMMRDEPIEIHVRKVWRDTGHRGERPSSVTVELLRDGVRYGQVVTLTANSWSYDWYDLDPGYRWTVREVNVGSRYDSYVTSNRFDGGYQFIITNTYDEPYNPSDPDAPPDRPPRRPSDPTDPEIPLEDPEVPLTPPPEIPLDDPDIPLSDLPEEFDIPDPDVPLEDLPRTGQLWWPVPMLAAGGILLFLIGWAQNRRWEVQDAE
ncbi:MAG: Cna B-type domain-containing protein [Lawsonibacter sp.]|nr:Cna B-type domain-containing protein [Lawsonibacter sp.]